MATTGGQVYYDPSIGYYYREPATATDYNQPNVVRELTTVPYSGAGPYTPNQIGGVGGGLAYTYYRQVPTGEGFGQTGQTTYTPPTLDFNNLPNQIPAGLQVYGTGTPTTPYQRPTTPAQPQGTGYRPQFDPTFIQQMLAQRFGNNQGTGIPTATRPVGPPTLTPGTNSYYPTTPPMQSGLGALQAMGNQAPAAPMGGTTNAPV